MCYLFTSNCLHTLLQAASLVEAQLAERGVCSSPAVCRLPALRHLRASLQAAALVEAQLAEHMAAHRAADVRTFHTWLTVRTPESSQVQI